MAAIAALAIVVTLPVALPLRLGCVVAGLAIALDQLFRRVPAFDPLSRVRWRLPCAARRQRICAITFDDGPSPGTAATLDALAAAGVPATFFVLAGNAERYPDLVRRAHAEGHAIGLHGRNHATLARAGDADVEAQIRGAIDTLKRLGIEPAPIYRTPHGVKSRSVFAVARRYGLTLWAWSRGVWDTDRPEPDTLVRRATRGARSGMVLLLHDGHDDEPTPDVGSMLAALPRILEELKRRGFTFVRLTDEDQSRSRLPSSSSSYSASTR